MGGSSEKRDKKPQGCPYGISPDEQVIVHLVKSQIEQEGELVVPLNSYVVLYTLIFLKALPSDKVRLIFHSTTSSTKIPDKALFKFSGHILQDFGLGASEIIQEGEWDCPSESGCYEKCSSLEGDLCALPNVNVPSQGLTVAGLCAVVRFLIKWILGAEQKLLGFQGGCLSAPAEVSTWTRFCEVDFPRAVLKITAKVTARKDSKISLPVAFSQMESHLRQPVKIHNIRKRMQQDLKQELAVDIKGRQVTPQGEDPIDVYAREQHIYAEGPDLLLSDVLLFGHLRVLLRRIHGLQEAIYTLLPATGAWVEKMREAEKDLNLDSVLDDKEAFEDALFDFEAAPFDRDESLYSSDPKRKNPAARAFTRQPDVERVLIWAAEDSRRDFLDRFRDCSTSPHEDCDFVRWQKLPRAAHPLGGQLPEKRLLKKCQQLANLAEEVADILKKHPPGWSPHVVDFCSGGGHLGILLAYLFPEATVSMVENKEESLRRAHGRIKQLGLTNCRLFQCNLDYFLGAFDIGVSLHACGVATDLVLDACARSGAHFVCCPCCYGGLQENHVLQYPRSKAYRDAGWTLQDYLIVGHTADQTHSGCAKLSQGERAMALIDGDRACAAEELGYQVRVSKLKPTSCTPKNNLIVGVLKHKLDS